MEIKIISLENRKDSPVGETKKVRRGHARYLIRTKKAVRFDQSDINKLSAMQALLEADAAAKLQHATETDQKLQTLTIQLKSRVADEKHLYGSLGAKEIAEAITAAGVPIEKRVVYLPNGPIREVGEHDAIIRLHDQVESKITVQVTSSS